MELKKHFARLILFISIFVSSLCFADLDNTKEISKYISSFDRTKSKVMIKIIEKPTRAKLDISAYDRNPLFYQPQQSEILYSSREYNLSDLNFGGSIIAESIKDGIDEIPLNEEDKSNPMAWKPMIDFLVSWDYDMAMPLMLIGVNVGKEKWGIQNNPKPLQQITNAYIDSKKNEMWVKIEFDPRIKFLKNVDDEDNDSFPEIYGCIDKAKYSTKLLNYLKDDYINKILSYDEIGDYFVKLSSDWYGAYKTETLDMSANKQWPNDKTEPEIVKELNGIVINDADAIIRGEPYGFPIYNVFIVKKNKTSSSLNTNTLSLANIIKGELRDWGDGNWENWVEKITDFRKDLQRQLKEHPAEIKGLKGKDGFLFFRGSLAYLTSDDLRQQKDNRDPFPAIVDYNKQLKDKSIDFLFVIIPSKPEIFPEKASDFAPKDGVPYVNPYTRKLMLELSEAGVEVIDLYPEFIKNRYGKEEEELLYMKTDTHWTDRGIQLAAKIIADRIKQYSWYSDVCKNPISYGLKEVVFTRNGDIRGMLPDEEKAEYRPMNLIAHQVVNPDNTLYKDDKSSPIVVLGDSFCGVYQEEEPKHAGLSAHIAKEIGMPIDLIMAYGSGPNIRQRFARRGAEDIKQKKLVIWTTASRDLYDYWSPWEIVKVP